MSVAADVRYRDSHLAKAAGTKQCKARPTRMTVERGSKAAIQNGSIIAFLLRKRASRS